MALQRKIKNMAVEETAQVSEKAEVVNAEDADAAIVASAKADAASKLELDLPPLTQTPRPSTSTSAVVADTTGCLRIIA